jgi:hypothetical protein
MPATGTAQARGRQRTDSTQVLAAVSAAFTSRFPRPDRAGQPSTPPPAGKPRTGAALRDRTYVGFSALNAVLSLHTGVLAVALPLWGILNHDPAWLAAGALVVNTVIVGLLQVRVAARVSSIPTAAKSIRSAGFVIAVACAIFALSGTVPPVVGTIAILLGVLVYSAGEMRHSAGSYALAFDLAPDDKQGDYQALFGALAGVGRAVSPAIVSAGSYGWLLLGVGMAVAAAYAPALLRARPGGQPRPFNE